MQVSDARVPVWMLQGSMDDVDSLQGLAGDADEMDEPLSVRPSITRLSSLNPCAIKREEMSG